MWKKQKASVDATLEDMGVGHKPRIVLYNKMDQLSEVRKKKKEEEEEAHPPTHPPTHVYSKSTLSPPPSIHPPTHPPTHPQEAQLAWSEEVLDMMQRDEERKQEEEEEEEEEEDEEQGMELAVAGSAVTGEGMLDLLKALDEALRSIMVHVEVLLPYSEASTLSQIHDRGSCDKVVYQADGTFVAARVPQDLAVRLLPYRVDAGAQAYQQLEQGEEIDWVALAKGRHTYKQRLQRGEVVALTANEQQQQQQERSSASAA